MLELYSTNQIPFCHIRLCSTTCHFLVNNLHLITYSNHIIQHHRKNSFITCFTLKGKSPDRQQPIKEPSQKYYPIPLFSVSSLTDITEFQFAFNGKIIGTWSDMFEGTNCRLIIMIFSLLEEQM